jgi:hypothetical protein
MENKKRDEEVGCPAVLCLAGSDVGRIAGQL